MVVQTSFSLPNSMWLFNVSIALLIMIFTCSDSIVLSTMKSKQTIMENGTFTFTCDYILDDGEVLTSFIVEISANQDSKDYVVLASERPQFPLSISNDLPQVYRGRVFISRRNVELRSLSVADHQSFASCRIFYYKSDEGDLKHKVFATSLINVNVPPTVYLYTNGKIIENEEFTVECYIWSLPCSSMKWSVNFVNEHRYNYTLNTTNSGSEFNDSARNRIFLEERFKSTGINSISLIPEQLCVIKNVFHGPKLLRSTIQHSLSCTSLYLQQETTESKLQFYVSYPSNPPQEIALVSVTSQSAVLDWSSSEIGGNPSLPVTYLVDCIMIPPALEVITSYFPDKSLRDRPVPKKPSMKIENITEYLIGLEMNNSKDHWKIFETQMKVIALYPLEPYTTYIVRIRSNNGVGVSAPSKEIVFTTLNHYGVFSKKSKIFFFTLTSFMFLFLFLAMFWIFCMESKKYSRKNLLKNEKFSTFTSSEVSNPQEHNLLYSDYHNIDFNPVIDMDWSAIDKRGPSTVSYKPPSMLHESY